MSDIFQRLSQQVLSPQTAIEPLRISHFTLFSERNLPLPNLAATLVPSGRAAKDVELHKRARNLPDPLVADGLHTHDLALPSLRGIGHMAISDHGAAAQPWPLTSVESNPEPGIAEITAETLAPEMTPAAPSSTPALQLPKDEAAPHPSPAPAALQENTTALSADVRNAPSLPSYQSSSSSIKSEKFAEKAELAFSNATRAASEDANSADSKNTLSSAQASSAQPSQEGKPITHRSTESPSADTVAASSVQPTELRTQEENVPSSIVQNRQPSFSPVQPEANRTEVEPVKNRFEHSQENFVAETAAPSSEGANPSRKEGAFITAPAFQSEPAKIPPTLQPLTETERHTASTLTPAHAPTEKQGTPSPITATTAIAKILPVTSVEAGDEERYAAAARLQQTQTNEPERALSSLAQTASEPMRSANLQPRQFRERTAESEATLAGAVAPALPSFAQASSVASQTIADHAPAYQAQPFAPNEPVSPAPLGTRDMASVQPISASSNVPGLIQRATLDSPPAKSVVQESTMSDLATNALSVGAAESTGEVSPQLQPLPQHQVPAAIEQTPAAEESVIETSSIGKALLQRKPSMAAATTTPGPMPIASSSNPPVIPALPTAAVPGTTPIAASEILSIAATLPGEAYAVAPVEPLLPHSEPAQSGTKQQSMTAKKLAEHEDALPIMTEPATFETTSRLHSTSDVSMITSSVQPVTPTIAEQPSTTPRPAALEQMLTAASNLMPTQFVPIVQPIPVADQPLAAQDLLSHSETRKPTLDVTAPSESRRPTSTVESIRADALPQSASQPVSDEAPLAPSMHGEVLPLRQAPIVNVPPISEQLDVQAQPSTVGSSLPMDRGDKVQQTFTTQIYPASSVTGQTLPSNIASGERSRLEPAPLPPLPEKNTRTFTKDDLSNPQQETGKESPPETTPSSLIPAKGMKSATLAPSVAAQPKVQNDAHAAMTVQPFTQTSIMPTMLQAEILTNEARSRTSAHRSTALDETVFALANNAAPEPLRGQTIVSALSATTNFMAERGTIVPAATVATQNQQPEPLAMHGAQPLDSSHLAPFAQEDVASVQPQMHNFVPMRRAPTASTPDPIPTIHVTIGRVFVHTAAEPAKPAGPSRSVAQPPLSLDAYLQQRQQEGR